MWRNLKMALTACSHPAITWYEATKRTFASHYLMNGGRTERLATTLGHTDTEVTRRYGHLPVDLLPEEVNAVGPEWAEQHGGDLMGYSLPSVARGRVDAES